jgi:hypothetical protein
MSRLLKLAKNTLQVYEEQRSSKLALNYVAKYVAQKTPGLVSRLFYKTPPVAIRALKGTDLPEFAILGSGGVGDLIVMARYLRDLHKIAGPFFFDVFSPHPSISEWIFRNVPGARSHVIDAGFAKASTIFDASLHLSSFVHVRHNRLNELADSAAVSRLDQALQAVARFSAGIQNYIDQHPKMDGFLAQKLQFQNISRSMSLHAMSRVPYGGDRFELPRDPAVLAKFGLDQSLYVTVHNGYEVSNITSGRRSTKCYPHFKEVVSALRKQFTGVKIVQLGSKTSTPIGSAHLDLLSKTTLEEASTIIGNACCHLDNESGLVHIASCHGTRCCVVFGPTPADYFGYESNVNIRPPVCGSCWWITENWMDRCPRGFEEPPCTYTQSPSVVAQAAAKLIAEALESRSYLEVRQLEHT